MTVEKAVAPVRKHQEFILAVSKHFFLQMQVDNHDVEKFGETMQQVIPFNFEKFTQDALPELIVAQRLGLETNLKYRQLLPYLVLTQRDKEGVKKYINYNRAKGSGEARLLGGRSVGFGGHIDFGDMVEFENEPGNLDLARTILQSIDREAHEELVVKYVDNILQVDQYLLAMQIKYLILSKDEKVGVYHAGLVVEAEIHPDLSISSEEDAIAMRDAATAEELLADPELEDWSRLFLQFKTDKNSDYSYGPSLITRPGSVYSILNKIGEEAFKKIETLMTRLLDSTSEEDAANAKSELEQMGYVDLIETQHGLRWSFNEQSFDRAKLAQELQAVVAANSDVAEGEQQQTSEALAEGQPQENNG